MSPLPRELQERFDVLVDDFPSYRMSPSRSGVEDAAPGRLAWLSARQCDRCLYCGCDTWLPWQRRREPQLRAAWDLPAARSLACQLAFDYRMATVEHIRRRSDGGTDAPGNLAMACAFCNSSRADRTTDTHAIVVCALKRVGRHPCFDGEATCDRSS